MSKYSGLKNMKHSLKKAINRTRRKGDFWYNKLWIMNQRRNNKKEVLEQYEETKKEM